MYQHEHVLTLQERIEWLEWAVAEAYEEGSGVKGLATGSRLNSKSMAYVERDGRMIEEIGLLSLRGSGAYGQSVPGDIQRTYYCGRDGSADHSVGSMTGITLAALVNSTLQLYERPVQPTPDDALGGGDDSRSRLRASYPPRPLAAKYIRRYIDSIHRWYPFLSLEALSDTVQAIYGTLPGVSQRLSAAHRFQLFMVFALAAGDRTDPHTPGEYYRAAVDFVSATLQTRSLDSCRALLLLCLYSIRRSVDDDEDAMDSWLLTGHAVRLGIELGLTRNNYKAGLSEDEHEQRRRIWWYVPKPRDRHKGD
jgi:hypothetical protein